MGIAWQTLKPMGGNFGRGGSWNFNKTYRLYRPKKKCTNCGKRVKMCYRMSSYRCQKCRKLFDRKEQVKRRRRRRQAKQNEKMNWHYVAYFRGDQLVTYWRRKKNKCQQCGKELVKQRMTKRFCSAKCRVYAARKR